MIFEPRADPDLAAVWGWFELQEQLIASERRRFRLHFSGSLSTESLDPKLVARFRGLDSSVVDECFELQRILELLTMLELLTTAEAILRMDFKTRVDRKEKDGLSRRYRKISKARGTKVRLEEDLLEALRPDLERASVAADFLGALRLRDWLAHGRYWHPKLGRNYSPADVFDICRAVTDAVGSIASTPVVATN